MSDDRTLDDSTQAMPTTSAAPAVAQGSTRIGSASSPTGAPPGKPASSPAPSPGTPSSATVLPHAGRPSRPASSRAERTPAEGRPRPAGRRRARLAVQRIDVWSVFLFSLVASICLGVVLLVAVAALYFALESLGVLASLNGLVGEVAGSGAADEVADPIVTSGRVLGATAVLAAVDVVLLTALATLSALLYNLCASLTGGVEVQLGERD